MTQQNQQTDFIRSYICNEIIDDPSVDLENDSDLLMAGYLDSVSVIRLVAQLENQYDVKIPPEDILIENFGTIDSISTYLTNRVFNQ